MTQKESRSHLYMIWSSMKRRCENPNMPNYKYYGAKGIKVCGEWHSFPKFKEWAKANGYVDGLSLDRIDSSRDYEPDKRGPPIPRRTGEPLSIATPPEGGAT